MTAGASLRRWRRALPWFGLVWLSLAGAQGVQVVAASLLAVMPAPGVVSSGRQPEDEVAGVAGSEAVVVMLTLRDPSTGRETAYRCRTTRGRVAPDALLIESDQARDVSQSLCDAVWLAAPALSTGAASSPDRRAHPSP
jgi:hypothetical protein